MINPIALAEIKRIGADLNAICGDDEQLFADMTEGESPAQEVINRLHQNRAKAIELIEGIKLREADLKERKARLIAREGAMKSAIGEVLRAAMLSKVELPEATYSVRDGKPKLVVVDEIAVPKLMTRVTRSPDKDEINRVFGDMAQLPNWLAREPAADVVVGRFK